MIISSEFQVFHFQNQNWQPCIIMFQDKFSLHSVDIFREKSLFFEWGILQELIIWSLTLCPPTRHWGWSLILASWDVGGALSERLLSSATFLTFGSISTFSGKQASITSSWITDSCKAPGLWTLKAAEIELHSVCCWHTQKTPGPLLVLCRVGLSAYMGMAPGKQVDSAHKPGDTVFTISVFL